MIQRTGLLGKFCAPAGMPVMAAAAPAMLVAKSSLRRIFMPLPPRLLREIAMLTAQRQIEMADNQPRGEMAMPEHQTPLIATIAAGLMLAFIFGLIAHRLRV